MLSVEDLIAEEENALAMAVLLLPRHVAPPAEAPPARADGLKGRLSGHSRFGSDLDGGTADAGALDVDQQLAPGRLGVRHVGDLELGVLADDSFHGAAPPDDDGS